MHHPVQHGDESDRQAHHPPMRAPRRLLSSPARANATQEAILAAMNCYAGNDADCGAAQKRVRPAVEGPLVPDQHVVGDFHVDDELRNNEGS